MTGSEFSLCLSAVVTSSISQLFMKSASELDKPAKFLPLLCASCVLQLGSTLIAVVVLRTIQLTQLIPFAAAAYVLVPIGSCFVFGERLLPKFWLGTLFIIIGIICINF